MMLEQNLLATLIRLWQKRHWRRDTEALGALTGSQPAVVVTGGSEGVGLALARVFAKSGTHTVVLIARSGGRVRAMADEIGRDYGVTVIAMALDLRAAHAAQTVSAQLAARDVYVDILINNAGLGDCGPFATAPATTLHGVCELNVTALTDFTRHFLSDMLVRGRGGIINIASTGGFVPGPYQAAYYASKAYVISLTRAIAWETGGQGVRVCAAAPGPINTEFHERMGAARSLYRYVIPQLTPQQTARSIKRGFALGNTIITPGLINTLLGLVLRVLPAMITSPIVAILLKPRPVRTDA